MMWHDFLASLVVSDADYDWNEVEFGVLLGLAFGLAIVVVARLLMLYLAV